MERWRTLDRGPRFWLLASLVCPTAVYSTGLHDAIGPEHTIDFWSLAGDRHPLEERFSAKGILRNCPPRVELLVCWKGTTSWGDAAFRFLQTGLRGLSIPAFKHRLHPAAWSGLVAPRTRFDAFAVFFLVIVALTAVTARLVASDLSEYQLLKGVRRGRRRLGRRDGGERGRNIILGIGADQVRAAYRPNLPGGVCLVPISACLGVLNYCRDLFLRGTTLSGPVRVLAAVFFLGPIERVLRILFPIVIPMFPLFFADSGRNKQDAVLASQPAA